ncbi:MAG: aminotransferase class V-fold PLP-dependent enzyme [Bacillota bacterium]
MKCIDSLSGLRSLVVGVDIQIPLINGKMVTAINFDNAATTPPLHSVMQEVMGFSPWYSSIHRGTGYKSQYSSFLYEKSRDTVLDFVKGDPHHHTVIYVKNTTEAINKLANCLCFHKDKNVILSTDLEHHSNDLPWRKKFVVDYIQMDNQGKLSLEDAEAKLKKHQGKVKLVTVTGASNVTGIKNPIHQLAALAHRYDAKIMVDGAQLIPHAPLDMKPFGSPEHIDYLAFSAHKMYAPFGIGVLIGPKTAFEENDPDHVGGGTVDLVTHDFVRWADPPAKEEAGSPNIIGVVALVKAMETLSSIEMYRIENHEHQLTEYAMTRLCHIPDVQLYVDCHDKNSRVSIIPFTIKGMPHDIVARILSYEGGIAVRSGCFCAQPYVQKLLKIPPEELKKRIEDPDTPHPGMVRISFGLYNTCHEIDILCQMLLTIVKNKKFYLQKYQMASPHFS